MMKREAAVDDFLNSGSWYLAEDREQTRRLVREFLLELPEEQARRLGDGIEGFLVVAPSAFPAWESLALDVRDIPPGHSECGQRSQIVYLDSRIEQYPYGQVRAVVFEALALAFAMAFDGLNERTAVQFAAALGRMGSRTGTRNNN